MVEQGPAVIPLTAYIRAIAARPRGCIPQLFAVRL
jgi:hypothetical protein